MNKAVVTLINPGLVTQKGDNLGSGIPYMPLTLAYVAACLRDSYQLQVIDAFGENPFKLWRSGNFLVQGLSWQEIEARINPATSCIIIYYSTIMAHFWVKELIDVAKRAFPGVHVIIIENPQAVIACSLKYIMPELLEAGADYVVSGEPEKRIPRLLASLLNDNVESLEQIDGLAYIDESGEMFFGESNILIENLDELPFPAWDLFPVNNYWYLKYGHGPVQGKYLAIMTSRGCPFNCRFCVIPSTNFLKWRSRSPYNVVEEIIMMVRRFGVVEFHLEDVNPTINEKRIVEICRLILQEKLNIRWKLVAGTKIETISRETLGWMKEAGCSYISFSPESGSGRVLSLMNKTFNHSLAMEMVVAMNRMGIKSQACFVLGFPGETQEDLKATEKYIKDLTHCGVDEIALFIMTPIPGTDSFEALHGYTSYSQLTFSPSWREDFEALQQFRMNLYRKFLWWKCLYHPTKVFKHGVNLLQRRFETKAEMNIYRVLVMKMLMWKGKIAC